MPQHAQERSQTRSTLFDPPEASVDSPQRTQLKHRLSAMPYEEQVEAVRPAPPVEALQTLQESPVQQKDGGGGTDGVKQAAAQGLQGSTSSLPYLGTLQSAFGHHDLSGVRAHTGSAARRANAAMGSAAYASGEAVAFRGAPDLHTVAHEAAHVVQQRAGVDLPGGVGSVGDSYEKHADAVASRVVRGETAVPLLDAATAGTGAMTSAVQMLHGEDAAIHPDLKDHAAGESTVKGAVDKKFGAATRDENWNNKIKVDFEVKLAALILSNPEWTKTPIDLLSQRMLDFLKLQAAGKSEKLIKDLQTLGKNMTGSWNDIFFGRLAEDLTPENLAKELLELLSGAEGFTIPQKLFAHHQFLDNLWDAKGNGYYWEAKGAKLAGVFEMVAPKELRRSAASTVTSPETGKRSQVRDVFGERYTGPPSDWTPEDRTYWEEQAKGFNEAQKAKGKPELTVEDYARSKGYMAEVKEAHSGASKRARSAGTESGSRSPEVFGGKGDSRSSAPAGIYARSGEGGDVDVPSDTSMPDFKEGDQTHNRGVDRLTMNEAGKFIQQARLVLDMPLAGGISGTTADLMEMATAFGLDADQKHLYSIAVLGHLEGAGGHSFHEIATAAKTAGVPYRGGIYASFLPASIKAQGPVQDLFTRFAEEAGEDVVPKQAFDIGA